MAWTSFVFLASIRQNSYKQLAPNRNSDIKTPKITQKEQNRSRLASVLQTVDKRYYKKQFAQKKQSLSHLTVTAPFTQGSLEVSSACKMATFSRQMLL